MVLVLKTKITQEVADGVEAEKRSRSIVITGLAEFGADRSLIERQRDLEEKVANVLDALEVDCLPEVVHSSTIFDSELIDDLPYFVFRSDSPLQKGGGVCCLVSDKFHAALIPLKRQGAADMLCFELLSPFTPHSLRFVVTYRPPDSAKTDDGTLFDAILEVCLSSPKIIIVGDFNVDMNKHRNSTTERFKTLLENRDLAQNIDAPTSFRSILDLVLSSISSISDVEILPPFANSDHNVVSFKLDLNTDQPLYLPLPDFSRVNYSESRKFFARVNWLEVFDNYQSVAEMYRRFYLVMYDSLAKVVPLKFNKNCVPTYLLHLRNLFDQKNQIFYQLDDPFNNALMYKTQTACVED
ncbi:hypothetical protein RB195_010386 [Necator americanus]